MYICYLLIDSRTNNKNSNRNTCNVFSNKDSIHLHYYTIFFYLYILFSIKYKIKVIK